MHYGSSAPPLGPRERSVTFAEPARILLAHDDRRIRRSLARLLELDGYAVVEVATGTQLMASISDWALDGDSREPFAAVVTAARLPGIDPLTTLTGLRALGWEGPLMAVPVPGARESPPRLALLREADVDVIEAPVTPEAVEHHLLLTVA